jgi:hypothetical protein
MTLAPVCDATQRPSVYLMVSNERVQITPDAATGVVGGGTARRAASAASATRWRTSGASFETLGACNASVAVAAAGWCNAACGTRVVRTVVEIVRSHGEGLCEQVEPWTRGETLCIFHQSHAHTLANDGVACHAPATLIRGVSCWEACCGTGLGSASVGFGWAILA